MNAARRTALVLLLLPPLFALAEDADLIKNGGFDRDLTGWSFWFSPGQSEGSAKRVPRGEAGALRVDVSRRDTRSSIQIYQGPFSVKKGRRYLITFQARAEEPWLLRVALMRNEPPWHGLGLGTEVPLTKEWRTYSLLATATKDCEVARIDFFPERTFLLDAVSIRPASGKETVIKPAAVRLGRGWRGKPDALLDGNRKTRVTGQYQPIQPLFVVIDLGEPKTVQQVTVHGFDAGRHHYTRCVDVEVSDDGTHWFQWARASKDGHGPKAHPTVFSASSLAVRARYLRLRVSKIRSGCILTGLSIVAGDEAAGVAPSLLPPVHPARDLSFMGWDYDRIGYAVTPGERVALSWVNQGTSKVSLPLTWRLTTYDGRELASGQGSLSVPGGETGSIPIPLPAKMSDGPKRIVCEFPEEAKVPPQAFYFDYRAPTGDAALDLRIVALHDSQNPEGWARMMAGPLGDHIIASRDWPEGQPVDAAVVMAENWEADDPRVSKLRAYVQKGGKALVYGKPPAALADLVPVTVDPKQPLLGKPMRLKLLPGGPWDGFDPNTGPRHYGVKVLAKEGARILATWQDGTPAVVQGAFGQGTVVYVGAGSGQVWQRCPELTGADELGLRLLYSLVGRKKAFGAALTKAREIAAKKKAAREAAIKRVFEKLSMPRPERCVVTSLTNVGRFGWYVSEGGLVENLGANGEMRCPAEDRTPISLIPDGAAELTGQSVRQNWLSKTIAFSDGKREVMRATVSMASPAVLWQGSAQKLTVRAPGVTHVAYATAQGVRIAASGDKSLDPSAMSANWLLLFTADAKHRDVPKLLVLTRRPTAVTFDGDLALSFDTKGFGAILVSRLLGVQRFGPGVTTLWVKGIPQPVLDVTQRRSRALLAFPVECDEVAWVDGNTVVVADRFRFRELKDDWQTGPVPLAAIPPVVSLAQGDGAPVKVEGTVVDLALATKYGPLKAVAGDSVLYRITLPPHDHYGVIPVDGQMDLQKEIDGYGLQGIRTVKRASGGLTSGSEFLEDLRSYMSSGQYPPFEAPCIDLYKWWYCFPSVSGRPAFTPEARSEIDAHYRRQYWQTVNFYPRKCFIRYRREPWTNMDYTISFIWPVMFRDGTRYFVDQNESAAVIAYCAWAYAQYYGDWTTLRANWNLFLRLYEYLPKFHDWAWMTSSNQEFFSTAGIDMLNSEYPGSLAFARAARQVGDKESETMALVLAAKAFVPAVARFAMPDYVRSITGPGDPWREYRYYFGFNENGLRGSPTIDMRGGPEHVLQLAIGMLDTSKGTSPEIVLGYKAWIPKRIDAFERDLKAVEKESGVPAGWMHLMQRAVLRWPRAELIATARKFHKAKPNWSWQSTKGPQNMALVCTTDSPLFLAEWAPAEYLSGRYDPAKREAVLRFQAHEDVPYTIRLYSQRKPTAVAVNGRPLDPIAYDAKTGWLQVTLKGTAQQTVTLRLGEPAAPLHPYYAGLK